jgi:hypothetical protein
LERHRCGGATGRSCGGDTEARLVGVTATTRRRGGLQAAVIWRCSRSGRHPLFPFKPNYGSGDPLPFRSHALTRAGSVASVVGALITCSVARHYSSPRVMDRRFITRIQRSNQPTEPHVPNRTTLCAHPPRPGHPSDLTLPDRPHDS